MSSGAAPGRSSARAAKASAAAPAVTDPNDVSALSFEDALTELDAIVRKLEGGQAKLEEAIADYERGAALRRHCEARLAEAEQKVQAIVSGSSLRDLT
nr:exodeoxyribonuclease VII small subunit [Roseomonas marmotae]